MPWRETSPMDQRVHFIADYEKRLFSVSELCARFGVSRKTGYKWIERYQGEGCVSLRSEVSRSRTSDCSPRPAQRVHGGARFPGRAPPIVRHGPLSGYTRQLWRISHHGGGHQRRCV